MIRFTKLFTGFIVLFMLIVFSNVAWAQGNALDLETDEYVLINSSSMSEIEGTDEITFSAWICVGVDNYNLCPLVSKWGNSYSYRSSIQYFGNFSAFYFNLANGFNSYGYTLASANGWHHVAMVFDGNGSGNSGRLKGYMDGVSLSLFYNGTIPSTTTNASGPVELGKQYTAYNGGDLCLDEIRIFDAALSSSDITNNMYNYISTSTSNLVAYYKMDNSSGTTVTDAKGSYNGLLKDKAYGTFQRTNQWVTSTVPTKWDGSSSTAWETSANWSWGDRGPVAGQSVIVPNESNDPIISSSDVSIENLEVESGATLTINPDIALTLTGNLTNDGTITLKSTASGTGKLYDNGTISGGGDIEAERYLTSAEYHLVSAPVSGQNVSLFSDANAFKSYDETSPAYNGSVSGNFENGRGYSTLYNSGATKTFSGTVNTSNVSYGVTSTNYGWNIVGNPFPTSIDGSTFLSNNSGVIDGTMWLWIQNGNAYANTDYSTYTSAGVFTGGVGGVSFGGNVEVGQGFWVKANSASNVTFARSLRTTGDDTYFSPDFIVQKPEIITQ